MDESNVPFHILMKQAADMKTEQLKSDRVKFDSFPAWFQNTLFAQDVSQIKLYLHVIKLKPSVLKAYFNDRRCAVPLLFSVLWYLLTQQDAIKARNSESFEDRISFASKCKVQGNIFFGRGYYVDAVGEYERTLGMFSWIEAMDKDWMKKVKVWLFFA